MPTISLTVKYDTYDNWSTNNPVLGSGEASVDTTHNKVKLGDGTTKWNDLQYITNSIADAIIKNTKGVALSSGQSLVTSKLYYNPATNLLTVGNDGDGTISASKLLGTANYSLSTSGVRQLSGAQVATRLGEMYYDTHDNCLCICTDSDNNKWAKLYDTSKYAPAINTDSLSTNSISTKSLSVSGNTSVPTQSSGNSSTAIANTKFVSDAVNNKASEVLSSSKKYTDDLANKTVSSIESTHPLKKYTLDLSNLDENTFYPVMFTEDYLSIEAEIHSRAASGDFAYNQNVLSFRVFAHGWSDGASSMTIKDYFVYDTNEITIGCVAAGSTEGGACVWLRGGSPSPYTIISTVKPQLFSNGYSDNSGQVFTVGPTYHGAETGNANISIIFNPLDIPSNSAKNLNYTTYGTFEKAIKDASGRVIKDTYATKSEVDSKSSALYNQLYLPRYNLYTRSALPTSNKTSITINPMVLTINGSAYELKDAKTLQLVNTDSWDSTTYTTASSRAGKDFYIYACQPLSGTSPILMLSANSTVPAGYTATNSRKIGGFHCECLDVGTVTDENSMNGYSTGDIIPFSIWDLKHRPKSSPEGMVYVEPLNVWISIYIMSWDGSKLVSAYNGVQADGASAKPFSGTEFAEYLAKVNMRLPRYDEFVVFTKGIQECMNVKGSKDVNTTGGHYTTYNKRIVSSYGIEDCAGVIWQWLSDVFGANFSTSWNTSSNRDERNTRGDCYGGDLRRLLAGGCWYDGSYCGSRASGVASWSANAYDIVACRGASEPLITDY